MAIKKEFKIGALIWLAVCGYGMYMGTYSEEEVQMIHYRNRLKSRAPVLCICDRYNAPIMKGEVVKIDEHKGHARTVYIRIDKESDSIYHTDYLPSEYFTDFSIKSGIMELWLGGDLKHKAVFEGSKVTKKANTTFIQFAHTKGYAALDLLHRYRRELTSCQEAQDMNVIEEYKKYLAYYRLSGRKEELPSTLKVKLEELLIQEDSID